MMTTMTRLMVATKSRICARIQCDKCCFVLLLMLFLEGGHKFVYLFPRLFFFVFCFVRSWSDNDNTLHRWQWEKDRHNHARYNWSGTLLPMVRGPTRTKTDHFSRCENHSSFNSIIKSMFYVSSNSRITIQLELITLRSQRAFGSCPVIAYWAICRPHANAMLMSMTLCMRQQRLSRQQQQKQRWTKTDEHNSGYCSYCICNVLLKTRHITFTFILPMGLTHTHSLSLPLIVVNILVFCLLPLCCCSFTSVYVTSNHD